MRIKSPMRRKTILEAAQAVFEEVGYEQATMSQIAARFGGSKATLYNYFNSKESLFLELVTLAACRHAEAPATADTGLPPPVAEIMALLDDQQPLHDVLTRFGKHVLARFHTPSMLAMRRIIIGASNTSDIGRQFYERGPQKAFAMVQAFFARAIDQGHLRPADPRVVEAHWRALLCSEIQETELLNIHPELTAVDIDGIVQRAVDTFLRAYAVKEPV
jgi:AcrR family transcriptional regulator